MKRITQITIIILLLTSSLNAQERKVKKALDNLKEKKFEECLIINQEIEKDYPDLPLSLFVYFSYYYDYNNPKFNLDKSYEYISKIDDFRKKNELKKEWCDKFNFCDERIPVIKDSISFLALNKILLNKNQKSFLDYLNFYKNSNGYKKGLEYYSEWSFSLIKESKNIFDYETFINDFPNSKEITFAKNKIEDLEYENCWQKSDIKLLESFILKYPTSKYTQSVNSKIENIEYEKVIISENKMILESFLNKYPRSEYLKKIKEKISDLNSESVIVTEVGIDKNNAINNCLIRSIDLVTSMFISSETVLNNNLITENIKQITSGNILKYEILNENMIDNTTFEITIKSFVRIDTLSEFFNSKGFEIKFDKNSFKYKINNQKLKEEQEVRIVYDLVGNLSEKFQKSFDYIISTSNPIKSGLNDYDWKIPLKISIFKNSTFISNYNLLIKVLKQLSIPQNELTEYARLNKNVYEIVYRSKNNDSIFYLRNRNSLNLLELFFNNYFNYMCSFRINNNVDIINGLNIYKYEDLYYYLDKIDETSFDLKNAELDFYYNIPADIVIEENTNNYNKDLMSLKSILINNLIETDTLGIININNFVKLEDLKKIKSYSVESNGIKFEYRGRSLNYLPNDLSYKPKIMINYINKISSNAFDTVYNFYPFIKKENFHIANEDELNVIFSNNYFKLLPLPDRAHWFFYDGDDDCRHGYHEEERKAFFLDLVRWDKVFLSKEIICNSIYDLNNVVILKNF